METFADGYEGVTHAGLAVVSADGRSVLLAQRSYDETDDEAVRETWEFPGGSLNDGEEPMPGAEREFGEEMGFPLPAGEVVNGWRAGDDSETGHYQGFVYRMADELDLTDWQPTDEVQAARWFTSEEVAEAEAAGIVRPEIVATMDWTLVFPETEEQIMDEPDYSDELFALDGPIPVHGVVAPEEVATGDQRGFNAGSMTRRPLRLPFSDQKIAVGGHDGSVVVGSVDRLMRKDGLIHWEGALMPSAEADDLAARMEFFGGRFGVSVDGDKGALDKERSEAESMLWFEQVRAAGLTAVAIPAFHEAYVAFGPHPEMPSEETLTAAAYDSGDLVGARTEALTFDRGAGWVTNPKETRRIHAYWTKKGEPGYAKIGWGTAGDFTRAKRLIGEKIAKNSPEKMKYLNQIIAQWHFDALGYWPGDLGKPGNAPDTPENRRRAAVHAGLDEAIEAVDGLEVVDESDLGEDEPESVWEAVLVSSVSGNRALPPVSYFHQHDTMKADPWDAPSAALVVEDPDENGFRRAWGYAAEWGVCHVGMDGKCVEPPSSGSDDYPEFHLGRTKVTGPDGEGYVYTGVLTYGVSHRDAKTILAESPEQAMFDNIKNAWAAVRVGENDRGIWFSGVVLPKVDDDDLVKIEASGQVSGEWKRGAMRACLTVNVPGFPNERASAEYDEFGNVVALAASAFGVVDNGTEGSECDPKPTPAERIEALRLADAEARIAAVRKNWSA